MRATLVLLAFLTAVPAAAQDFPELLRNRLEAGRATGQFRADGDRIHAVRAVPDFYLQREYRPAWLSPAGRPSPRADSLLAVLADAHLHGLDGTDYHGEALGRLRGQARAGELTLPDQVDLEILLTDAFLVYGSHLLLGRVDPVRVQAEWLANRRDADLAAILDRALQARRIRDALEGLAPTQPGYARLREALAQLVEARAEGGWEPIPAGATLREGESDPRVPLVRARLAASTDPEERTLARYEGIASGPGGEEGAVPRDPQLFDAELAEAVRRFQHRHGLDQDGAVGARTLEALNVPVETRIRQVLANLERWRWLPDDLGRRHIRVNIAAFETEVWDQGEVALRLRSIVGRQYRMTPSFTGSMRYLVLAPYWHVPPTIAAVDKLPEIRRDISYLQRQRFTVLDAANNEALDPGAIDWAALSGTELNRRYRLRQDPGPLNALGNVKFMFPNPHNVYLHDTPQRELFERVQRDFSSGCIRVDRPLELAAYLLGADPQWTPERIRAVVAEGRERSIFLPEPVPVHLLYMTSFVDPEGRVHFRTDIYGRDRIVLEALAADPPAQ